MRVKSNQVSKFVLSGVAALCRICRMIYLTHISMYVHTYRHVLYLGMHMHGYCTLYTFVKGRTSRSARCSLLYYSSVYSTKYAGGCVRMREVWIWYVCRHYLAYLSVLCLCRDVSDRQRETRERESAGTGTRKYMYKHGLRGWMDRWMDGSDGWQIRSESVQLCTYSTG